MTNISEPERRSLFRRPVIIAPAVVLLIVLLWCGYWFAVNLIATNAIGGLIASMAANGRTVDCTTDTTGGFPLSLDLDCTQPHFSDAGADMAVGLSRLTATAPVYSPGSVAASLSSPMAFSAPVRGYAYDASWERAVAEADAGLSGLKRVTFELDELAVTAKPDTQQKPPFSRLTASRAELVAEPAGRGAYRFYLSADDLQTRVRKGSDLPLISAEFDITAEDVGKSLGTDPRRTLREWLDRGGTVNVNDLVVTLGGTTAHAGGTLELSDAGLLSGRLDVRLTGLNKLAKAVGKIRPGAENQVKQLVTAASMVTKPVEGQPEARDVPLVIQNGVVSVGVVPVGTIPPLRF
ncbi:MAG: DUF2125 domain-containing protein [Bauldia sp.]|nr:DUF2125 domain-containing protein [Bauldia sp.]